jgi:hypothetical protein
MSKTVFITDLPFWFTVQRMEKNQRCRNSPKKKFRLQYIKIQTKVAKDTQKNIGSKKKMRIDAVNNRFLKKLFFSTMLH